MNTQTHTAPALLHRFAARMDHVQPSAIRELFRYGADPRVMSFGGGYPDASLFPLEAFSTAYQAAIEQHGPLALQYIGTVGVYRLREQIAARMCADGVPCTAEDVLILHGAQQGLDLVARMLIDKGDVLLCESPTFLGGLIAFNPYEPRYCGIPMDDDGMDMDALEHMLALHPEAKLLYTVPDFQNPSGVTLSLERRLRLMELARRHDLIILEDSPYRDLRFEGETLPTLKSLDPDGRVIFLGSFSKILAPGLRLGWAVASPELLDKLALLKLAADSQCSTLNMVAISLMLETFDLETHINTIRDTYRDKKALMLHTIREHFPASVHYTNPSGGLFTWLTFPEGFDSARFMLEYALPEAKVAYVPGATFFPIEVRRNHARLSYSSAPSQMITDGMTALGKLLQQHLG